MKFILLKILIVFLVMGLNVVLGQEIKTFSEVEKQDFRIGEQVKIKLKVEKSKGQDVRFPEINKFLTENVEIIDVSKIDTQNVNETEILTQTLLLTAFDSGNHKIPSFKFVLKNRDGTTDTISTAPSRVRVSLMEVDTTKSIKDIKDPIDTPFKNNELWSYINYLLYAVILIVVGLIGYQYYKINKPKGQPKFITPPVLISEPPDVIALKDLKALENKKNWKDIDGVKDFHEEISFILRKYIQARFGVVALERTSHEILNDIKNRAFKREVFNAINQVLSLSDFVKYAKYQPSKEENQASLDNAYSFINQTKAERLAQQKNV